MRIWIVLLCWVLFCGSAQANDVLVLKSETGDYVGLGQNFVDDLDDGNIYITSSPGSISFTRYGDPAWHLEASSPSPSELRPACYERARRLPPTIDNRPRFDFGYGGRGCNKSSARFKVLDFTKDPVTGDITKFAVDFVQHCSDFGPALFGKLRYNSAVSVDGAYLAPVWDTTGFLHFQRDASNGNDPGAEGTIAFDRLSLLHKTYGEEERMYSVVSLTYGNYNGPWSNSWRLDMAAPDHIPLTPDIYPDAQRYPFQSPGHAGLSFSFGASSSYVQNGAFEIFDIRREPVDHFPSFLMAAFDQHYENAAPTISGEIALSTHFQNGPFVPDVIYLDGMDGSPKWPLVWDCN